MKRITRASTLVVILVLSSLACTIDLPSGIHGSGNVLEEGRDLSGVTGVTLAMGGTLNIELGEEQQLRIEAEDNLIPYIESDIVGSVLEIGVRHGMAIHPTRPIDLYLTVPALDQVVLAGSGMIQWPEVEGQELSLTLSGSGAIRLGEVQVEDLRVVLSGSGDVSLSGGRVDSQWVTVSGSGAYEAENVESATAHVGITGSGTVTINVRGSLLATVAGSGQVRYLGDPVIDQVSITGSGTVVPIGH